MEWLTDLFNTSMATCLGEWQLYPNQNIRGVIWARYRSNRPKPNQATSLVFMAIYKSKPSLAQGQKHRTPKKLYTHKLVC